MKINAIAELKRYCPERPSMRVLEILYPNLGQFVSSLLYSKQSALRLLVQFFACNTGRGRRKKRRESDDWRRQRWKGRKWGMGLGAGGGV